MLPGRPRSKSIAAIRELYAKGDVAGAMALATKSTAEAERAEQHGQDYPDASVSIQFGPDVEIDVDVSLSGLTRPSSLHHGADSPDASVHVEVASEAVDISLSGLTSYGADAPDASVHVTIEAEAVDVSLTGLESFESGMIDVSLSSLIHPADVSLQGLTNIIEDIESSEPTIGWKTATTRKEMLAKQRLFAQQLGPVIAPHITMPPPVEHVPPTALTEAELRSIPRVLKAPSELANLPLGPRGGFVLALMDGTQTVEEILDVCAMSTAEATEIIRNLESLAVIRLE